MAIRSRSSQRRTSSTKKRKSSSKSILSDKQREKLLRYFPAWLILLAIGVMVLPTWFSFALRGAWNGLQDVPGLLVDGGGFVFTHGVDVAGDAAGFGVDIIGSAAGTLVDWIDGGDDEEIAAFFTDEVQHWQDKIVAWAQPRDLDPNLVATIMQIESCGHPSIRSSAGAAGLFQVMPFHFASSEDATDPDTNAQRGTDVLAQCLSMADGDAGLAMACYNGGPSVISRSINTWPYETQRYYYWGTGIYSAALSGLEVSPRLNEWLTSGQLLCDMAAAELD